jgi:Transposase DDE domain
MRYKYKGKQKGGKGRPKVYGEKVDVKDLDLDHFTLIAETTEKGLIEKCYEGLVYIDSLCCWAKVVVVQYYNEETGALKSTYIYFSTDKEMSGIVVLQYYRLRFQIEFLFRDTKQHIGLTQCQSTDSKVLHFHWNLALTVLNIAKAMHHKHLKQEGKMVFSIVDIKTLYSNKLYLNTFISAFGINPENPNNSPIINRLLAWGTKAA